jgi:hypothetical protein
MAAPLKMTEAAFCCVAGSYAPYGSHTGDERNVSPNLSILGLLLTCDNGCPGGQPFCVASLRINAAPGEPYNIAFTENLGVCFIRTNNVNLSTRGEQSDFSELVQRRHVLSVSR